MSILNIYSRDSIEMTFTLVLYLDAGLFLTTTVDILNRDKNKCDNKVSDTNIAKKSANKSTK